ncbi:MAG: 4a-hydroxytetrahydrobiopterin dehydratase [Flavobacteriales bacterium]|nr:4a-hydroxytetrahydrobiopterin dehydratase [Flavobacteriales bacterium]
MSWDLDGDKMYRKFTFDNFDLAWDFMNEVAQVAKKQNHHPEWKNVYNQVEIWLSTHDANDSITFKDLELANEIDLIFEKP